MHHLALRVVKSCIATHIFRRARCAVYIPRLPHTRAQFITSLFFSSFLPPSSHANYCTLYSCRILVHVKSFCTAVFVELFHPGYMRAITLVVALACCAKACTDIQFEVTTAYPINYFGDVAPIVPSISIWRRSCAGANSDCQTLDDEEIYYFKQVQGLLHAYFRRGPKTWKGWNIKPTQSQPLPTSLTISGVGSYSYRIVLLLGTSRCARYDSANGGGPCEDLGLDGTSSGFTENTAAVVTWGKKGPVGQTYLKVFVSTKLYSPGEAVKFSFPPAFGHALGFQLVVGVQIDDSRCTATTGKD